MRSIPLRRCAPREHATLAVPLSHFLELLAGIEPALLPYKGSVIPLYYSSVNLELWTGIGPVSHPYQGRILPLNDNSSITRIMHGRIVPPAQRDEAPRLDLLERPTAIATHAAPHCSVEPHQFPLMPTHHNSFSWCGWRDSDPRRTAWKADIIATIRHQHIDYGAKWTNRTSATTLRGV